VRGPPVSDDADLANALDPERVHLAVMLVFGTAAAIANAVHHATGVRIRTGLDRRAVGVRRNVIARKVAVQVIAVRRALPIRPDRLLDALTKR
jgi:CO/xanthine dehydrogenase Mo-binding subunit